jgi:hypothetical protein
MLVSRLDGAGLDVKGESWAMPTPGKFLISEAVWSILWSMVIDLAQQGTQSLKRKCQRAAEKLAAVGVWSAAELSLGMGWW